MAPELVTVSRSARASAAGTAVWVTGGLAFGLLLPLLVAPEAAGALGATAVDLPALAVIGLDVASWLRGPIELAIWCGGVLLVSVPGWRLRQPRLQRGYLAAGLGVLATMFVLAFAVHQALAAARATLGD